jgi:calcineurin-like phosphoesterase family protein
MVLAGLFAACAGIPEGPLFSFGVLADVQYCDGDPAGVRHYRLSPQKLESCIEDLETEDLAFAIHLGDFIDRDIESIDKVLPIYRRLEAPTYFALGNHDFSVDPSLKDSVPAKLGMERRYYDFPIQDWRFIVLDGNALSLYAHEAGHEIYQKAESRLAALKEAGAPNAMTWNGGLGKQQLAWLRKSLEKASEAGEKAVIFCHFPVYPQNLHNLWDSMEVIQLLSESECAVAYLNGHNHGGNYGTIHGIHFLTIQGMVDTADQNAYAVVDVYDDRLEVRGRGRVPCRVLSTTR